jgi:hypothetical protein
MRRFSRKAAVLAGALIVPACGGDDTSVIVPAGGAAEAEPDSSLTGNGGGGGAGGSTLPDASADVASNQREGAPDVSVDDTGGQSDVSALPDAASETSVDAPSDTVPADGSDDAVADAADGASSISKICAQECQTSDQCVRGASPYKPICEPTTHRCVSCIDDLPCIAGASAWIKTCTADSGCTSIFGDYCVDIGGLGVCAFDSAKLGTASCLGNAGTITLKKFGSDAQTVSVCAKLTTTCDLRRGRCESPCIIACVDGGGCTNTCTVSRGGKMCNGTTQRCECASDSDCAFPIGHCNLLTAQCECASSNDCAQDSGPALVCQ